MDRYRFKIGRNMLTVNIDIQDCLINDQTGIIRHIESDQGSAHKVYVQFFDEQAGSNAMRSYYLGRQNSWVCQNSVEKCEAETSIKKRSELPSIKRTQFYLTLASASTIHKVQSLRLERDVINFDIRKQRS